MPSRGTGSSGGSPRPDRSVRHSWQDDVSPTGEWTQMSVCDGDWIGPRQWHPVNACYDAYPAAGKIRLQSEGFELFVRTSELHP